MPIPGPQLMDAMRRQVAMDGLLASDAEIQAALMAAANLHGSPLLANSMVSQLRYLDRLATQVWADRVGILQRAEVLDAGGHLMADLAARGTLGPLGQ